MRGLAKMTEVTIILPTFVLWLIGILLLGIIIWVWGNLINVVWNIFKPKRKTIIHG